MSDTRLHWQFGRWIKQFGSRYQQRLSQRQRWDLKNIRRQDNEISYLELRAEGSFKIAMVELPWNPRIRKCGKFRSNKL